MPTSIAAIEVAGLVKTYKGGVRALDGLDLHVEPGTVFGLLGPNGAGKSTSVKVLTTLTAPDGGTARVAGFDVVRQANQVRHAIGYVPQKSSLDPDLTGRENLILQGQLYNLSGRQLKSRAAELLERFDLTEAADRLARGYSGGMQRKLEVAMGLVHQPRVLFLDEPTTGLDPEARASMWEEIDRLVADERVTILLTTHYLEEADKLASRLAIIDHGRVVGEGTPEELKAELHGDTIQVELEGAPDSGITAVNRVAGLREVSVDGRVLRARADRGAAAVPAVLAALEADGAKVASVTISRPSLEDVYLRYAGRAFTEADKEQAA
ncbi:MAG: ATP-binding cassette domain-containing protein [Chloroflexi bacterium]|nr:ATP-binding cassette domain-containing protein [Chloroflexota bacterium]